LEDGSFSISSIVIHTYARNAFWAVLKDMTDISKTEEYLIWLLQSLKELVPLTDSAFSSFFHEKQARLHTVVLLHMVLYWMKRVSKWANLLVM
jgi:hypothetical protein